LTDTGKKKKIVIQSDFDGTITPEDISFQILDKYSKGDWRSLFKQYRSGNISVGRFNTLAFAMVKEDEQTLVKFVREKAKTRPGFVELVKYCREKDYHFVIVSNGLDFYIKTILEDLGLKDVEFHAASTEFGRDGVDARYIGPEGKELLAGFKEAYTRVFLENNRRVIYIGNGPSDIPPARMSDYAFATGPMLELCKKKGINCTPFDELTDIIRELKLLD